MKAGLTLALWATVCLTALSDDITFTNRTANFTDLEGRIYSRVQLVRGDLDGLIWRRGASGGRICYTNLDPCLLESFGISTNRIAIAQERAEHKAVADARYRTLALAEARSQLRARATALLSRSDITNAMASANLADVPSPGSTEPAYAPAIPTPGYSPEYDYTPGFAYGPGWGYGGGFPYFPGFGYGPSAPLAPRAPSAPSARSAPSFASAPSVPSVPYVPPPPVHPNNPRMGR